MKTFQVPPAYRSPLISAIKNKRKTEDKMKKDFSQVLLDFGCLQIDDIVITPAFGTSLEIDVILKSKGIHTEKYNTTCPFVEKVWNRSEQIAEKKFTVIV